MAEKHNSESEFGRTLKNAEFSGMPLRQWKEKMDDRIIHAMVDAEIDRTCGKIMKHLDHNRKEEDQTMDGIVKPDDLKEMLKGFFEKIFDQEMLEEMKAPENDHLGGLSYGLKFDSKDLYKFATDDEAFKQTFVDSDKAEANIEAALHFMRDEIHYGIFNFCGCGWPDKMDELVMVMLNLHDEPNSLMPNEEPIMFNHERAKKDFGIDIYDITHSCSTYPDWYPWLFMFVIYQLEASELTEHGSTIRCSWLTDRGRLARRILNEHAKFNKPEEETGDEEETP